MRLSENLQKANEGKRTGEQAGLPPGLPTSRFVPKLWGLEYVIVNHPEYCGKLLMVEPGWQCSLHYHPRKNETFWVKDGVVDVEVGEQRMRLVAGQSVDVAAGTPHRFGSERGATLVEFSSHHSDDDVVRLEASRRKQASVNG